MPSGEGCFKHEMDSKLILGPAPLKFHKKLTDAFLLEKGPFCEIFIVTVDGKIVSLRRETKGSKN